MHEYTNTSTKTYFYAIILVSDSAGQAYLYNTHGDVVKLIGTLTWSYQYDAYGVQQNPDPLDGNAFRYAGQYYDTESGTYYLRARYYNPNTGRFTQQDAWTNANRGDPLGLNLYCYCNGNPILYIDITGNFPTWGQIGQAVLIGAIATVTVVAVVATAGAAGAAIGTGIALAMGASAATATTLTTAATVGAYVVASGVAVTAASDIGEVLTGHNVIRDDLMGGNQDLYDGARFVITVAASAYVEVGSGYGSIANDKKIRSSEVRYSQNSISSRFSNGVSIQETIDQINRGELSIDDLPPIRVFEKDGLIYTLDNRRLYVAQQTHTDIHYVWATQEEIQNESWKFTTNNFGMTVRIRK